jgi:flagellar biosynthesis/type III secretory pathway protein FliH
VTRVEEIKAAIDRLTPKERSELAALLNPAQEDEWDRQMKKDAAPGGKLNRVMEAANEEYEQGKSLPFPKPAE